MDFYTIISSVRKTNRALTIEEGPKTGGVGAEICAKIVEEAFDCLDSPVERIAAMDTPVPFNRNLEKLVLPQIETIVEKIKTVLKK